MKSISIKAKIYLTLQIIFTILTFAGFVLLFIGKIDNAGMSICGMVLSLVFGVFYKDSTKHK